MSKESLLIFLADSILIVHTVFVGFVVLGLAAIYLGALFKWSWVRHRAFRITHLLAIVIVVSLSWIDIMCPLTTWEMAIRAEAGSDTYSGSFIQHWLQSLLYYTAPEWVFTLLYTVFAALVVASWFIVPPRPRQK